LVGETVKSLEAIAAEKNIRLVINRGNQSVSQVVGDRDKVKEIILNLVGNAVKFSNQGEIKITVFDSEITKANKDQIAVSVTDAGRGISPQNQMYLFHKFQQATSSIITRDTTKGTGLGLYISKLMVEGMDGSIFLEKSEEGKGATFAFTLPRVKA
jgi:signal transduction histidine kinase